MELQEFIKTTLVSIKNGIRETNLELAKQEGKELGKDFSSVFVIEPHGREKSQGYITFDVAVTVGHESKKSGGGGLKVSIVSLGGELGDINSQEHVSRIKFNIIPNQYVS